MSDPTLSSSSGASAGNGIDTRYELEDRYRRESGRVWLTGVQALVRLPMMQRQRDLAAGMNTAGFISGYRGSPLGTYDMALWQAEEALREHHVRFEPGINEDLAATAVWGSQQANLLEGPRYDGVFGIWYGKGPGVDRSCDALKHGNYAGTSATGGVLALAGDDPAARSSSIAHQSEHALVHCGIPVLNPSSVQDYLDLGLYGFALSRYAGLWVGFKCLTDTVDSARSVEVDPGRVRIVTPDDFEVPPGLHIGWTNLPAAVEKRLYQQRIPAAQAFVRANGLDRVVLDAPKRRFGIVTTGKAYLDVRQALGELGIDDARAAEIGLCVYKVAMSWPLEPVGAREFATSVDDLLVVEEKRAFMEDQLARLLYHEDARPRLAGKEDDGVPLIPSEGELDPDLVAGAIRLWLARHAPEIAESLNAPIELSASGAASAGLMRLPSFCSGCPHNTSTVVPEDSIAMGGIGCHGMAVWLPGRNTLAVTQMGGEGANWIGQAPFTDTKHIFQNIGDGTYFHSGLLAIRAAVTAGVNITYKVLVNGAVAMTGGQLVDGESMDGEITTPEIARQLHAEGVGRIAVVSDHPEKYPRGAFPSGVTVHHRDSLDAVQRELRDVAGVSAMVYDQTCAAEARRLRKRGEFPDPDERIVINTAVCEGCGDCSVQSNCISIEPVETELGRKRRINQSSCNKDYSCLKGLCPSFVSVRGGRLRKTGGEATDTGSEEVFADLPEPGVADTSQPFNVLVTGIGGTGVITVGALLGMAAHLEGKGASELDVTGLAQKNGPVTSHIRIAAAPEDLHATRIAGGTADLLLGCDIVVAAGAENLSKLRAGRTTAVVNQHVAPTSDFASNPDLDLGSAAMEDTIRGAAGSEGSHFVQSTRLATAILGDAIASNLFLVGYALQLGRIPVSLPALERAIELNGRGVAMNKRALRWGRLAAHDAEAVERAARPALPATAGATSLEASVDTRAAFLTSYQSARYARRYRKLVDAVGAAESRVCGERGPLTDAVARYYFKLLAYKDEYEVARLFTNGDFQAQLDREFEGDYTLEWHPAPPHIPVIDALRKRRDEHTGRTKKVRVGSWAFKALGILARFKFLRGTPLDPFGVAAHRKLERQLIRDYEKIVAELTGALSDENRDVAVEIASIPDHIRGFDLVKEEQLESAQVKQAELLESFRLHTSGAA